MPKKFLPLLILTIPLDLPLTRLTLLGDSGLLLSVSHDDSLNLLTLDRGAKSTVHFPHHQQGEEGVVRVEVQGISRRGVGVPILSGGGPDNAYPLQNYMTKKDPLDPMTKEDLQGPIPQDDLPPYPSISPVDFPQRGRDGLSP